MSSDGRRSDVAVPPASELLAILLDEEASVGALQQLKDEVKRTAHTLHTPAFLEERRSGGLLLLDVRSPCEFEQGHVPGAVNMPLFSNEERELVGTCYHQRGQAPAMSLGMSFVRPKLLQFVETTKQLLSSSDQAAARPKLLVYCWRGGLRSSAIAWLLRLHDMEVTTLFGGYKAFRQWVCNYWGNVEMPPRHPRTRQRGVPRPNRKGGIRQTQRTEVDVANTSGAEPSANSTSAGPDGTSALVRTACSAAEATATTSLLVAAARALPGPRVCVIGGRTGVGKTKVLHALRTLGQDVIDLEGLANHRGSTFGWVGGDAQPSNEHFHNLLAMEWHAIAQRSQEGQRGWMFLEDEDTHIGNVSVPKPVYAALRCAPLVVRIHLPESLRVQLLISDYTEGHADGPEADEWMRRMEASVQKLTKRLGSQRVVEVLEALRRRDFRSVARAMLLYYDKLYDNHLANQAGTGSGGGERPGLLADVSPAQDDSSFDAFELAVSVLKCVAKATADGVCNVEGSSHSESIPTAGQEKSIGRYGGAGEMDARRSMSHTKPFLVALAVIACGISIVRLATLRQR
eukprot:scaffold196455_cov30-Tisochrysis_lutea.AAC.1